MVVECKGRYLNCVLHKDLIIRLLRRLVNNSWLLFTLDGFYVCCCIIS